jgi:hypothetical protein
MRGLQRLANVTSGGIQKLDDEAGQVADELTAALADSAQVTEQFRSYVSDVKTATNEARAVLAQLTNSPLPGAN